MFILKLLWGQLFGLMLDFFAGRIFRRIYDVRVPKYVKSRGEFDSDAGNARSPQNRRVFDEILTEKRETTSEKSKNAVFPSLITTGYLLGYPPLSYPRMPPIRPRQLG